MPKHLPHESFFLKEVPAGHFLQKGKTANGKQKDERRQYIFWEEQLQLQTRKAA